MKFFWISWYQPGEDYRPPKWPLPKSFLGYWCSGEAFDGSYSTLCAHVKAKDESAAKSLIAASWPDHGDFRFCEEKAEGWTPGSRFPKPKWATSATAVIAAYEAGRKTERAYRFAYQAGDGTWWTGSGWSGSRKNKEPRALFPAALPEMVGARMVPVPYRRRVKVKP